MLAIPSKGNDNIEIGSKTGISSERRFPYSSYRYTSVILGSKREDENAVKGLLYRITTEISFVYD